MGSTGGWCDRTSIGDIESSFWLEDDTTRVETRPVEGRVDVAIVGAGVTGCACALGLAEAGLRVRVHEAREVAGGASGRNGGFALRGAAVPYHVARAKLGRERAALLWRLTERALGRLSEIAGDAFRATGSLRLARDASEAAALEAECEALNADGFAAEWQPEPGGRLDGLFDGALFHPVDGAIHPARWVRRLARRAVAAGAEIRERDPVMSLAALEADRIVLATDGYTHGLLPALDGAVRPTRGQVIATEPFAELVFPLPHYTYDGFVYWHQLEDGRLILGGFRDRALDKEWTRDERTTAVIQEALDAFARQLMRAEPLVVGRWSGIFGTTEDLLPIVGAAPHRDDLWVSCGCSGHGNVLGFACGELLANAMLGRPAPELELFDPARVLAARPESRV
jgi:gamma-glutamylputrescine oxidase